MEFVNLEDMPSMDDLLGEVDSSTKNYVEGKLISGVVVEKKDNGALIDIGYKAEGFVGKDEFKDWEGLKVKDTVDVFLETIEDENNMPEISVQKAELQKSWDILLTEREEGDIVKGLVKYRVKGGLIIDIGVDGFLPGSHVDIGPVRNLDDFLNKEFEFKILKINVDRKNIILSRRELLEEAREEQKEALLKVIGIGDIRKGVVKNITDFGAFIDLNGMDGLLHITDMSWGRISHPSEMLSIGDETEVMILDIDTEKRRVSLGLKQKSKDPWEKIGERFPVSSLIKGKVVNIMPYGAFIEIEEGIEGLIHVSEMSWTKRITRASDVLMVGEEVEAVILDIQSETKKISLGLRQTTDNPWELIAKKYPVDSTVNGKVRNLTSYGAFVEIQDDIDGMIHVSDMSWTRKINNPAEVLKKGDEVEAVVLEINPEQQRISLGIKQLSEDPWEKIGELFKINDMVKGKVTKITSYGAFVELMNGIDGLVHITQLSDKKVNRVKDVLNLGDDIEAKVIKIDDDERRIALSMRSSQASNFTAAPASEGGFGGIGDIFDSALEGLDVPDVADEKTDS
ncbi:MAG: 30S ribosomal protein S1 [Lentisphaeraceae bacterium]|nr:30S ribosomal protein S1 [Lentisphaeraceae bacterium]